MGEAKEPNKKQPKNKRADPTRSFDGSVVGPGSQIGPFRIEHELGRGGAGVVYLAHDTKLDRSVAIKSLPPEVKENPKALSRFTREARVLASLNHPNIATIYEELEEAEGLSYLVLEYVPGQTLTERIAKKPLKLEEALSFALQIAEAVAAAHEHDVIHRDLKPGNIKITQEGKVKVLDFGLAKVVGGEKTDQKTTITEPGRVIGTPAYMSPEQARGKPTGKRSDIWSFGCVLYEMLTGRVPFKGETISDTLANILQTEPRWQTLPENIPANIQLLLRHCLEKEPRRRLRDIGDAAITIEDTTTELRRSTLPTKSVKVDRAQPAKWSRRALPWFITGAAVTVLVLLAFIIGFNMGEPSEQRSRKSISGTAIQPINAIVVLPFENLSDDPEQEYFVDGMTDALSAELGKIKALTVISRNSAMRYKNTEKSIPEIAKELGVDVVIEGSVLKAGNNVRVTALLVDGRTDAHLWSDNYTGTLTNILALQSEVTLAIAQEIEAALTPEEERRIARTKSVNPEAYEAFLKSQFFYFKGTQAGYKTAIEYLEKAIEIDPNYAEAYARLAPAYWVPSIYGYTTPLESFRNARWAAETAIGLDDSLSMAHRAAGWVALGYDWEWNKAEQKFNLARELNPNDPLVYQSLAWYFVVAGRFEQAIEMMQIALKLDPLSLMFKHDLGVIYSLSGQFEKAVEQHKNTLELDSNYLTTFIELAETYMAMSKYSEAITAIEKAMTLAGRTSTLLAMHARACALQGRKNEAQTLLAELEKRRNEWEKQRGDVYVSPDGIAAVYVSLGDEDKAFQWLEKAYKERNWMMLFLRHTWWWDPLRKDPKFNDLLQRMNFPETPVSETAAKAEEATQAHIEKIAVLPFTSISSEAGEEWFVDGMTDALITQLGKIKALTVISRTSAMQYKNISKPMREIAQDLGVDALVEGSVTRAGNDVQITARLIDGRTDERIWGDFFQGTFTNILALQSQVTLAIAQEIEVTLTPEEETHIAHPESVNPKAYAAFLKGKFYFDKLTEESMKRGADYFKQAIEIDPNYAEAYAWLSFAYWVPSVYGYTAPHESFAKAKKAANTAIQLEKACGEAHAAVGWIALMYDWDWKKAKISLNRAIELNPNYSRGYQGFAWYLVVAGHLNEAIDAIQTALKLDPLAPVLNNHLADMYSFSGLVEQAIEQREKTLELYPGFAEAIDDLAVDYLSMSMYTEAIASVEKAMSLAGRTPELVALLARAYALSDRKGKAETLLQELQERATSEYVSPIYFAELYASLGNTDEAFRWLEKAQQERNFDMLLLKIWPAWDSLRSDPRFDNLVQRMKFPE